MTAWFPTVQTKQDEALADLSSEHSREDQIRSGRRGGGDGPAAAISGKIVRSNENDCCAGESSCLDNWRKRTTKLLATTNTTPAQAAIITTLKSISLPVCRVFSQRSNISVTWPPSIAANVISTAQRSRVLRTGTIVVSLKRSVKLTTVTPVSAGVQVLLTVYELACQAHQGHTSRPLTLVGLQGSFSC